VELPEGGGRVANLVEALDSERGDELAAMEVADGVAAGEGWRREDGRVGLAEAGDEVDLLEGLLDGCVWLVGAPGGVEGEWE
jgi:hypothetical protein